MTKVCCYNCCSCQGYHIGMRSVAQGRLIPSGLRIAPTTGGPLAKRAKPQQLSGILSRLLASSLSCLSNCRHCRSDFKITLPILYFNSEMDASVRQFVFLGKCKERRRWHGDALRLDSILPPMPCAVQRTASGGSVPSLPTPGCWPTAVGKDGLPTVLLLWCQSCKTQLMFALSCRYRHGVHALVPGSLCLLQAGAGPPPPQPNFHLPFVAGDLCERGLCLSVTTRKSSLCFLVEEDSVFQLWTARLDQLYN